MTMCLCICEFLWLLVSARRPPWLASRPRRQQLQLETNQQLARAMGRAAPGEAVHRQGRGKRATDEQADTCRAADELGPVRWRNFCFSPVRYFAQSKKRSRQHTRERSTRQGDRGRGETIPASGALGLGSVPPGVPLLPRASCGLVKDRSKRFSLAQRGSRSMQATHGRCDHLWLGMTFARSSMPFPATGFQSGLGPGGFRTLPVREAARPAGFDSLLTLVRLVPLSAVAS